MLFFVDEYMQVFKLTSAIGRMMMIAIIVWTMRTVSRPHLPPPGMAFLNLRDPTENEGQTDGQTLVKKRFVVVSESEFD